MGSELFKVLSAKALIDEWINQLALPSNIVKSKRKPRYAIKYYRKI